MKLIPFSIAFCFIACWCGAQSITKYTPSNRTVAAGVGAQLIIEGNGFGSSGSIKMPNADVGGTSDITLETMDYTWTNTKITITVPSIVKVDQNTTSTPGSGKIKLITANNTTLTTSKITIPYAITNFYVSVAGMTSKVQAYLGDDNSNGGYTFDYNFSSNPSSSLALEDTKDAMEDWRCAVGVNFELGVSTNLEASFKDGKNTIFFTNDPDLIRSSSFGEAHVTAVACGSTVIVNEIDIALKYPMPSPSVWSYGSEGSLPANLTMPPRIYEDFFYTIKHELGHAVLLDHVLQKDVMYFVSNSNTGSSVSNGSRRLAISTSLETAGEHVVNRSSTLSIPSTCSTGIQGPMVAVPASQCLNSIDQPYITGQLKLYPNPASGFVVISAPHNTQITSVNINDITGKTVSTFSGVSISSTLELSTIDLPKGVYLVQAFTAQGVFVNKLIVE